MLATLVSPIEAISEKRYRMKLGEDDVFIGDDSETEFKPIVKLTRWDGEAYFKTQLPDEGIAVKSTKLEDGKVKWSTPKVDIHIYPINPSLQFEHGGIGYNIILKEKPPVNYINLPIETQNLKFLYQGELHPEHPTWSDTIINGHTLHSERPENIVGSYAVYHTSKRNNKYMCGKAFHIPRPRAVDANGSRIFGNLKIDEAAGLMTFTFDSTWLESASYPIIIGTPDTTTGYFHNRDVMESWEFSPANMIDGDTATYASCDTDGEVEKLTAHNCLIHGGISKVEIRAYGYTAQNEEVILRPVFTGGDGDNHTWTLPAIGAWSSWYDITSDTNAPSPWVEADFGALEVDVEYNKVGQAQLAYISKVEVRLTYNNATFGKTGQGGTGGGWGADYVSVSRYLNDQGTGTTTAVVIYLTSADWHCKGVIYNVDGSNDPSSLQGSSAEITTTANAWNTTPVSCSISNNTQYYLGIHANEAINWVYDDGGEHHLDAETYENGVPDPFGSGGSAAYNMSVYCNFDVEGAPPPAVAEEPFMETLSNAGELRSRTGFRRTFQL